MLNNNKISDINATFAHECAQITNLMLTNNKINNVKMIEIIGQNCPGLLRLSLVGNIVSNMANYRLFTLFCIPSLRTLDFQKVTETERRNAKELFKLGRESEAYKCIT